MKNVEIKNAKLTKGLVALASVAALSTVATAGTLGTTSDSFGDLLNVFVTWMNGNLGKMLALLGFIGTFVIYLMTHKGGVLFIGIIISLIAGGLVGIVSTFFAAGSAAFA
jgi:type IV secretory pathway VirB2 component (pilin)